MGESKGPNIVEYQRRYLNALHEGEDGSSVDLESIFSEGDIQSLEDSINKVLNPKIPEINLDLLTSVESIKKIEEEIKIGFQDFCNYLKDRGVNQKYIEELVHVTPMDEVQYKIDGKGASASSKGIEMKDNKLFIDLADQDPTKKVITMSASSISFMIDILKRQEIFSRFSSEYLRSLAVRLVLYHEMSHSLQQAYLNYNGKYRESSIGLIDSVRGKTLESNLLKFYSKLDESGDWSEELESEKQAEGMANDALLSFLGYSDNSGSGLTDSNGTVIPGRIVESVLRRKRIHTEKVSDDSLVKSLRGLFSIYSEHKDFFDIRKALSDLSSKSLPKTQEALRSSRPTYWYGLMFPRSRRTLKPVFDLLSVSPSNSEPVRKPSKVD